MIGGLCLFLFGMNVMGQALERSAGSKLRGLLGRMTTNKAAGFVTGLGVTAIIQSSSATTVMVVGFVNSGLMTLRQAINVIMGANVGTTVTAWLLSLGGIDSDNFLMNMLKPTSFSPILALIGVILYMFCKSGRKRDIGIVLLGFATLMFGMDAMSGAISGNAQVSVAFGELFAVLKNPILGVLAGAIITGVLQSSSASVGILQAVALSSSVSYGAAVPIIMGQNIGTCVTALISSTGATKNAKRAALVHLFFNIIGTVICLGIFSVVSAFATGALEQLINSNASAFGIAIAHSIFNIVCTLLLLPMSRLLELLVIKLVPDSKAPEEISELDERLFATPALAISQSKAVTCDMAICSINSLKDSMRALTEYTPELAAGVREGEERTDRYEDILGSYLVKLSAMRISAEDNREAAMLLRAIGDFERISDHSVNILESVEELREKDISFSDEAKRELKVLTEAVSEILDLALEAFRDNNVETAFSIESLEEVIDGLKDSLRDSHILRLQQSSCSIEAGFVWADLLTNLERVSDHSSNIAGGVIDYAHRNRSTHESLRAIKAGEGSYNQKYEEYSKKYSLSKA